MKSEYIYESLIKEPSQNKQHIVTLHITGQTRTLKRLCIVENRANNNNLPIKVIASTKITFKNCFWSF